MMINDQQWEEVVIVGGFLLGWNENDVSRMRVMFLIEVVDSEVVICNEKGNIIDVVDEDEEVIEEECCYSVVFVLVCKYILQLYYGVEFGINVFEVVF